MLPQHILSQLEGVESREHALQTIANGGFRASDVIPVITPHLGDEDDLVRNCALECFFMYGDSSHASTVLVLLNDPWEVTRITCIECLVEWECYEFCDQYWEIANNDSSELVRGYAISALGDCECGDLEEKLLSLLKRNQTTLEILKTKFELFWHTGDDQHLIYIQLGLQNIEYLVRCNAARMITTIGLAQSDFPAEKLLTEARQEEKSKAVLSAIDEGLKDLATT